jgi:hypothetical protein
MDDQMISTYNYEEFTAKKVTPWLNFGNSPPLGIPAPDFPLWYLDGSSTTLSSFWANFRLTASVTS